VARPSRRGAATVRRAATGSLPWLRGVLGDRRGRAHGGARSLGARSRARAVRRGARPPRAVAADRGGPRRDHRRRGRPATRPAAAGNVRAAIRTGRRGASRSGAVRAAHGGLHRNPRQRHEPRLVRVTGGGRAAAGAGPRRGDPGNRGAGDDRGRLSLGRHARHRAPAGHARTGPGAHRAGSCRGAGRAGCAGSPSVTGAPDASSLRPRRRRWGCRAARAARR
jgi:hypothetical protein